MSDWAFGDTSDTSKNGARQGRHGPRHRRNAAHGLAASALAIPLGILGGRLPARVRLSTGASASFIRFMTDVMTGVPSVIMGVFIYSIWVLPRGSDGRAWAAALALASLMLPIVVRSTEEMLRLVPDSLREASAALGDAAWKNGRSRRPPSASPASPRALLAVARAAGETAPVVFVIGFVTTTNFSLRRGQHDAVGADLLRAERWAAGDAARMGRGRHAGRSCWS